MRIIEPDSFRQLGEKLRELEKSQYDKKTTAHWVLLDVHASLSHFHGDGTIRISGMCFTSETTIGDVRDEQRRIHEGLKEFIPATGTIHIRDGKAWYESEKVRV